MPFTHLPSGKILQIALWNRTRHWNYNSSLQFQLFYWFKHNIIITITPHPLPQFSFPQCDSSHSPSKDFFNEKQVRSKPTLFPSVSARCTVLTPQLSISQLLQVLAVESFSKNCPLLKRTASLKCVLLCEGQPPSNDERSGAQKGLGPWSQGQSTPKSKLAPALLMGLAESSLAVISWFRFSPAQSWFPHPWQVFLNSLSYSIIYM